MQVIEKVQYFQNFFLYLFIYLFIYFVFVSNEMTKDSCKLTLPGGNAERIFKDKRKSYEIYMRLN